MSKLKSTKQLKKNGSQILEKNMQHGMKAHYMSRKRLSDYWELGFASFGTVNICNRSEKKYKKIIFVEGNAFDTLCEDNIFDLVFTSSVLIHISQKDFPKSLSEIYRVSRRFIMGIEYFSPKNEIVNYRGDHEMLWKMDFESANLKQFPDLKTIKWKIIYYKEKDGRILNDIHFAFKI